MHSAEVNRAAIGVVRKPHGVRGGLKVTLYSIDLEMLRSLEQLFVNTGDEWQQLSLKSCQGYADFAILNFNEIPDRTAAEMYRGCQLYTDRDDLPELAAGEFYFADLIGCAVVDQNQNDLGEVSAVLSPAAHAVLVIKQGSDELLVPLVKDWVTDINIQARLIQINPAEEI